MSRLIFSPISIWVLFALILLVVIGLPLLFFGLIGAALGNLGFGFWMIVLLIIAIVVGSFINIPLGTLKPKSPKPKEEPTTRKPTGQYAPSMYDKMYRTDRFEPEPYTSGSSRGTQISINVGGAVIPILISMYIILMGAFGTISNDPWYLVKMAGGLIITTVWVYLAAKPVRGIGIATPFFIGPIVTLAAALILGGGFGLPAAGIAYVAGTLGTLIGADLLHLKDVPTQETSMLSIGGAGTFDGIFLTGIITALIASF
ncbi:protein of unknown function DUF1614 [Methanocorpusculum labreanum Z]|uniref:DUF1614 domain-containing protein n=1 Tax=Methanocorpusculum labreanum (strain ATCC 43576 / DSM 4855 / Z) TaxID=410358 RepID=A2SPM9_METLZ|nr:DUF1614 domain-containing protein [Methanocorpusculum labreanum]ABN06285.1 protein of unknown function DUF1614 [Methanocorpusculum labreanum Z]